MTNGGDVSLHTAHHRNGNCLLPTHGDVLPTPNHATSNLSWETNVVGSSISFGTEGAAIPPVTKVAADVIVQFGLADKPTGTQLALKEHSNLFWSLCTSMWVIREF
ncbi:hypothetical protein E2C01_030384 [Portunus trituberculatus]|uniref:Uncharacterized protein n=1 Tax=Portunus trituberculatus TaxID=210409 RepID=A0A5B7EU45_PORTR|nr:hypothetical protein [Portunus trituberculatus]